MSMSTTRSLRNRSSRYSSPATFAETQVPPKPVETQRTSHGGQATLNRWMEPVVRNPVASFEDTRGLERVGVLEHMAPLGVPPSQKLLQKLKVSLNRISPRVTPINTEDVTPPTEPVRTEVTSPIDTEPLPESIGIEAPVTISSPPRGRPAKRDAEEMRQIIDITTPSPIKSTFTSVQASPRPQSIQDFIRQDRLKNVIERAITEANSQSDLKLVPGLQQIWEDAKSKPQLWSILDAIVNRTPTEDQFRVFKKYIKKGVRQYRRNSSGQNTAPNVDHVSSPQPQPVGFLHTFHSQSVSSRYDTTNNSSFNSPSRKRSTINQQMSPNHRLILSPTTKISFPPQNEIQASPKHKRTRSESSSSSLSSAKSMPEDFPSETTEVDAEGQATEGRPVRLTGQRQATNRVAAGSRFRSTILPQSDVSQQSTGVVDFSKPAQKKQKTVHRKEDLAYDSERIEAKRSEFRDDSFYDYNNIDRPESDLRTLTEGHSIVEGTLSSRVPPPVVHPYPLIATTANTLTSPIEPQAKPELPLVNGTVRKRTRAESDESDRIALQLFESSPEPEPASAPLVPPAPPASTTPTVFPPVLGTTPRNSRFLPPNKARKSARVMVSPNKPKNGGITAGIARAGTGREVAIGNGADSGAEDNDEFCASCGGEGTLLCCDGCTNSFHHGCLEPPLNPDDDVEGEWFCPRCIARRNKEPFPATGLLGQVIRRVDHTIPKAYTLPFEIRDYFEGVKTGEEGEYEEIGLPRNPTTGAKMNRSGFIEEPSYKELRDSKGNFIICYRCQQTSNGRDIIPCDYCPAKWHTDCVDPPLAVPPRRRGGDKPTGYWRCPLHIENDLAELGRQPEATPGDLGRVPRLRRPKKAIHLDVELSRGFRNNGVIEVELMKDEMPDIRQVVLDGGIYRLPEKGIRLDFIDRVKKSWYEDKVFPRQLGAQPRIRHRHYRPDDPVLHHPAAYTLVKHKEPEFHKGAAAIAITETARANAELRRKSFKEQSAVMSLIGLSKKPHEAYSIDPLADLTNALVAEAPQEAAEAINESEKDMLLRLQKLINGRLALLGDDERRKNTKLGKTSVTESGLLNGDLSEQLNGGIEVDGDDEREADSDGDIHF